MTALGLLALVLLLLILRLNVILILLCVAAYVHWFWGDGDLTYLIDDLWVSLDNEVVVYQINIIVFPELLVIG